MFSRICSAIVLASAFVLPVSAQTIRFDTNVGSFDMELNPTGIPGLQPYVDNLLEYVESGRYNVVAINRAPENFVLQMGGFQATTLTLPSRFSDLTPVPSFPNLIQDEDGDNIVDVGPAAETGLFNRRGTVAMALSNVGNNPSNPEDVNSGTREFFINVGRNNSFLDTDGTPGNFVPFAEVTNMATVDLIMSLPQMQTADGDGRSSDMPVLPDNRLVFIERAFVLETPEAEVEMMLANELAGTGEALVSSNESSSLSEAVALQSLAVPEPPGMVLAVGALVLIYVMKPNKIR